MTCGKTNNLAGHGVTLILQARYSGGLRAPLPLSSPAKPVAYSGRPRRIAVERDKSLNLVFISGILFKWVAPGFHCPVLKAPVLAQ
jgi:hypothetical protein